ncbi:MAG: ATP-dependent helicase [Frankiales bacterium]|nr:ATP-dependent helicase [Frankiales bacterium]
MSEQSAALRGEIAREQELVDAALARLSVLRAETSAAEEAGLRGGGGTPQAVYERDVTVLHFAGRRAALDAAADGLVFGRLDRQDGTTHHIGRVGVRTEEQHALVVDWRAPAAAAFYRATAAQPDDVVRRRTISCRGDKVTAVEDELLDPARAEDLVGTTVVGDGAFLAALSKERTGRMRDIVATIQREQDEAVRAPDDGVLLVTGGPGTGKTAVALHRVAFLMYSHRERFSRRGVLVVGPSPVFVDYVSQVLPTLGETSVRLVSLETLVTGTTVTARDSQEVAAVKGSLRMAEVLRKATRTAGRPRVDDVRIVFRGRAVTVPGREQATRRSQLERSPRSHNSLHGQARTALVNLVVRAWIRAAGAEDWSDRAKDDLREEAAIDLRDDAVFEQALASFWPVLDRHEVFARLRSGDLRLSGGILTEDESATLVGAWRSTDAVTAADAVLLDELDDLIGEPPAPPEPDDDEPTPDDYGEVTTFADRSFRAARDLSADESHRDYAHVVVDEAQDVSPMQWRALGRRARSGTWTVVGDWAQSVWPHPDETAEAVEAVAGKRRLRRHELTTNYRTSTEIADLAATVLTLIDRDATPPAAVRSTGHDPVVRTGVRDLDPAIREAVGELLTQVTGTVGVIATANDALRVRSVVGDDPRLLVLDTWQAKGMEFDGCLVISPEHIATESPAGLRSLYVAITRATQRLIVLTGADRAW